MFTHTIPPIFSKDSRVLILGTFPSVKSRESGFYYGHPQNRFWKLLSEILKYPLPDSIDEKIKLLNENRIALWDVIDSCEVVGSADSSIRNVVPNDIMKIISQSSIQSIFLNGKTAEKLWLKYCAPHISRDLPVKTLPSTSPANAAYTYKMLQDEWSIIASALFVN